MMPSLNWLNALSGLVNASANMVSVGQYSNFTSPDAILSSMKKYWRLIWRVHLLLKPLPFFSTNIVVIQYWLMNFLSLWLQKITCPKYLRQHIIDWKCTFSWTLMLVCWHVDDPWIAHLTKVIPLVWLFMSSWVAYDASTHHFIKWVPSASRVSGIWLVFLDTSLLYAASLDHPRLASLLLLSVKPQMSEHYGRYFWDTSLLYAASLDHPHLAFLLLLSVRPQLSDYQGELVCIETKAWLNCGQTFLHSSHLIFVLPDLLWTSDWLKEWWLPHPYSSQRDLHLLSVGVFNLHTKILVPSAFWYAQ